jgi:hypothetical protein
MKKQALTLLLASLVFYNSPAQSYLLIIQGAPGKFYLDHTVVAKENWYSIGRLFNISPKLIAPFNGMAMEKPLAIGVTLKIPLTSANFNQTGKKMQGESLVPLYHVIQEREWMYHISMTYNKVPIDQLEKWNHITKEQAKAGMQLIVGFLKVQTAQSALASRAGSQFVAMTEAKESRTSPDMNNPKSPVAPPQAAAPEKTAAKSLQATDNNPAGNPSSYSTPTVNSYASSHHAGGFFTSDFSGNNKMTTGQAATFKSTSGWQDGKYYALMNNIAVGTIVKVTYPTTSKSIYAKVLGQLPDMKESAGLAIRISNAAASELGAAEGKFPVEVNY